MKQANVWGTQADVSRLRIVRRLVDQGWRPGKLLAASEHELRSIIEAEPVGAVPGAAHRGKY